MNQIKADMAELRNLVIKFRDQRGWKKYHNPKDLSISIAIEAAELMELFQWKDQATPGNEEEINKSLEKIKRDKKYMRRIKEELADVLIYCLSLSDILDIDMGDMIKMKMKMNEKKYPIKNT